GLLERADARPLNRHRERRGGADVLCKGAHRPPRDSRAIAIKPTGRRRMFSVVCCRFRSKTRRWDVVSRHFLVGFSALFPGRFDGRTWPGRESCERCTGADNFSHPRCGATRLSAQRISTTSPRNVAGGAIGCSTLDGGYTSSM